MAKLAAWAAAIPFPINTLLFLFRILAVFHENRLVIFFFATLWLAITATALLTPWALEGVPIGDTKYCTTTKVSNDASIGIVISAVNDTLVFLAISARLLGLSNVGLKSWPGRMKTFFTGDGMGKLSFLLLQTGQLYYLYALPFSHE